MGTIFGGIHRQHHRSAHSGHTHADMPVQYGVLHHRPIRTHPVLLTRWGWGNLVCMVPVLRPGDSPPSQAPPTAARSSGGRPEGVAHLAGPLTGRVQRCIRCDWKFPQPPPHLDVEPMEIEEGALVEHRFNSNGYELTMLNLGHKSLLPDCRPGQRFAG